MGYQGEKMQQDLGVVCFLSCAGNWICFHFWLLSGGAKDWIWICQRLFVFVNCQTSESESDYS